MPQLAPRTPVVFIHGLGMHASSWGNWVALFDAAGYQAIAPGWPGEAATVAETRRHPEAIKNSGIGALTDHYQALIADLPATPIVIGHGVGGLVAQRLIARGFACACVALAPAPFQRVLRRPLAQIRTTATHLGYCDLRAKASAHTAESYHHRVANVVSRSESDRLLATFGIPVSTPPRLHVALGNSIHRAGATVDLRSERGPLLMIAGSDDRTVPVATVYSAYKIQRRNAGVTQFSVFDRRGHSLAADHGWREIADATMNFLTRNAL